MAVIQTPADPPIEKGQDLNGRLNRYLIVFFTPARILPVRKRAHIKESGRRFSRRPALYE